MRLHFALVLILLSFVVVNAQERTTAAERVDQLKLQLLELQGKEEALRARAASVSSEIRVFMFPPARRIAADAC